MESIVVGKTLRKLRKLAGYTQDEMADKMLISRSNISRMESGKLEQKFIDVLKWCKITNNPDAWTYLYAAIDLSTQLQPVTQVITGTILRLGGF